MSSPRILLTFDSIHDVLRAEKVLLSEGLYCDVVPTPRHISSDCGMSIECLLTDEKMLEALRNRRALVWRTKQQTAAL